MAANVLVVVIDGFRASSLGAYGNTTFPTPYLDQFAAESLLFDWCYAASSDLQEIYRGLWWSSPVPAGANHEPPSIPQWFATQGYTTSFITDEPDLAELAERAQFDDVVVHKSDARREYIDGCAIDPLQTNLATLFSAGELKIAETLAASQSPKFVWLHALGMYGEWDAPLISQESLLDEGAPHPTNPLGSPNLQLNPTDDPDAIFKYSCAYAAQIMVLDTCCERLLGSVLESSANEWVVLLVGARGFPLGEHQRIGGIDSRLYAEQLHVPCVIRFPDARYVLTRSNKLIRSTDVLASLIKWVRRHGEPTGSSRQFGNEFPIGDAPSSDAAVLSTSTTSRSIRTPAWCLREDLNESNRLPELYVRPDDRWEANDVAKLCPEVVEELHSTPLPE